MIYRLQLLMSLSGIALAVSGCGRGDDSPAAPLRPAVAKAESGDAPEPPAVETREPPAVEPPVESQQLFQVAASKDPAKLREQVLLAMEAGRDDQAYELVRQAVRVAPEEPQVVFLLALVLADRHRFPEAIKILDDLAEKAPSAQLPVLGQTAEWMVEFGQWSDAETRYRTLLENVPNSVPVHRNLARLLVRQGRRQEAAILLRQMCTLGDIKESELRPLLMIAHPFPGDAEEEQLDPIGKLSLARNEISRGNWQAAGELLRSSKSPAAAETALQGRVHAQMMQRDALAAWVATASESAGQYSESADYWFATGVYHSEQGEHSKAVRCFCEAVLRDQTDAQAYSSMGKSLEKMDATAEAEAAFKRAELIEKTQSIGAEMAASETREYEKMSTLIELLNQLQRPMESLSWRGVRLAYGRTHATLSDAQAQQVLAGIMRDRSQRLKTNEDQAARKQFLLCGVDLDSLEPLEQNDAVSETQP